MNTLRLRLHQHTAVYRNPTSSEIVETYPLVPPSTVLGLLATLLKREIKVGSLNISIQGDYEALLRDYQWYKKYETQKFSNYPLLVHTLHDVYTVLHITSDDKTLQELEVLFQTPPFYLYLGRAEDLLKVEDVRMVQVKETPVRGMHLKHSTYMTSEESKKLQDKGILYRLATFLHSVYVTVGTGNKQQTKMIRDFDWHEYHYLEKNTRLEADDEEINVLTDGEYDVWWLLPSQTQ
jgi:CRISPR-associated protein Cas5t